MEFPKVYMRRDHHQIPSRFWFYALLNSIDTKEEVHSFYLKEGFDISEGDTNLYKSLTDEEKNKIKFLYIDGIKQV